MTLEGFNLSREELLGGLPARRASTTLAAIEGRTARLAAKARQAAALYLTATAAEERERAFLDALAAGRDLPAGKGPTVQDLERFAPEWAPLVPADPGVRAAVAHLLGGKYRFTQAQTPGLRAALGLDTQPVREAYERQQKRPIESIYVPQMTGGERLRWAWARLASWIENLPPFWVALALTLPAGPGLLALPIAVADVGPLAGIAILVVFGLINMLTVAALAETVARSGITRFGLGYLGQLVSDYLGNAGSIFLTVASLANMFLALLVFYLGVAGTLAGATRLPAELWLAALFGVGLYFLSRKSLNSTVASALIVTVIVASLLIIIPLLALPHVRAENLAYVRLPFVGGQPFDPSILRLVFGVMLTNYFSHMLVANFGRVVIRRDPSARSWIWGSVTAIAVTTLISCLWIALVNGAIPAQVLAAEAGTALVPLAAQVGPAVLALGSVVVVLSLGMATIHISLGVYYLIQERLPARAPGADERGRFLLSISPVIGVFLLAEYLAFTGGSSFAGLLGFSGVISLSLLGGIFPVLLVAAARRKGDFVPAAAPRLLGSPVVLVATYLLFLSAIFIHGLVIWPTPLERAVTLAVGVLVLLVTVVMLQRGALRSRVVLELRQDQSAGGADVFNVTVSGRPASTQVRLTYPREEKQMLAAGGEVPSLASLRSATFQLPARAADQLKVWAHRLTPEGGSEGLAAQLEVRNGGDPLQVDLVKSNGQALLPLDGSPGEAKITLGR
jgi:amino acid permease